MEVDGLRVSIATIASKVEAFSSNASYAPDSSTWIISQIRTLETGLERIQQWLSSADLSGRQLLFSSLQDAADTLDGSAELLLEDQRPRTPVPDATRSSRTASDSHPRSRRASQVNEHQLEAHSVLLRNCIALVDFALAVCYSINENISDQEVRELAVGSKTLKETLTCTRSESRALWEEQKSEAEQYISPSYDAFIDAVLLETDEDRSESSASEVTIRRTSSGASSVRTDFTTVVARGSEQFSVPDELHLPRSRDAPGSTSLFSGSLGPRKAPNGDNVPVIIPFRNPAAANVPNTQRGVDPAHRPRLSASASFPRSAVSHLRRKPIKHQSTAANASVVSLSTSSSSSSAAEKALNIASEMEAVAQSPTRTIDRADSMNLRRMSTLPSMYSNRTSLLSEKYQDSPPPYVPAAAPMRAPPAPPAPTPVAESAPKRRETLANSRTPYIISLVRENQLSMLRSLPKEGLNVDEVDPATGRTALMESALLRQHTISQILVFSGSRLHLKDADGNTALHFAATQGDAATCQVLLDAGAQFGEWNKRGETPLQVAALGGHTEAVVCLLQNQGRLKWNDAALSRAFYEASRSGNVSTAQAFLDSGMKPKKVKETWKPIAYAAQSGSIPMLDFMVVAQNLNVKARSPDGWTALHFAARHGHASMVERLLAWKLPWKAVTKKTNETALHLAIAAGHTSTAEVLMLHKDANVNIADSEGQEPIHHAVRNGDLVLTTALLSRGARLGTQNKYGWRPIHLATAYGHLALVADFMTRGFSIDDKLGSPAFKPARHTNEAARKGLWAEIRWPHPGARPLHLALEFGHDDVAHTLIQGGARLDEGDAEGWTPLHHAAFNCRLQMLHILLARGASPHATSGDGNTPASLGFRGPGLAVPEAEKVLVSDALHTAMNAHKKSKLRQLTSFMNSPSGARSRSAAERNRVWHTAELAAALFRGDGEDQRREQEEEEGEAAAGGGTAVGAEMYPTLSNGSFVGTEMMEARGSEGSLAKGWGEAQ